MSERKSDSYVMTVDPSKKADMAKLEAVREAIKVSNKSVGTNLSIKCHGRLGPNNPKAAEYKGKRTSTIKLEDASRWDVYVFGKASKAKTAKPKTKAASKR
jgi:hypothetical protein